MLWIVLFCFVFIVGCLPWTYDWNCKMPLTDRIEGIGSLADVKAILLELQKDVEAVVQDLKMLRGLPEAAKAFGNELEKARDR